MREIKFRVWDNVNYMSAPFTLQEMNKTVQFTSDSIVMQYTGLKDKNGKEIYEGDIVRILYTDWASKSDSDPRTIEEYLSDISYIMVVVWSFNGFYASLKVDGWAESLEVGNHGRIEVIGNIHSNPELLK